MASVDLAQIATQLKSQDSKDRMLALAALRDVPAAQAAPLIRQMIHDQNMQIRSMAVFALGLKPDEQSFDILINLLTSDPDYGIRADAAGALGYLEDPRAFETLVRAFYEDTDWLVRFSAAVALGNLKNPRAHDVLVQALQSDEAVMQQAAIAAIGEIGDLTALEDILKFAQSPDWLVRQRLAEALGHLPSPKAISALRYLEKDAHFQVAEAARISLDRLQTHPNQPASEPPETGFGKP
ncbi:MAG TPA: HEAT repeat domain-containing protein [Leptolyngbyaceae cyanobacterium M65_K2018_010]|nr:HEAT repeat domain-containing protein [Leptolyngbyaceae cyanobacterium M65_K2018_010]